MLSEIFVAGMVGMAIAGNMDSQGAPSTGSGMYTLQNLYDYLTSGTALTVQASFQEPTSGPGSTMKTTKEIGDAIKALLDQSTGTADEVKSGERFFCTQPGSWGIQTGTAQLMPTPTPSPTITPTPTVTPTPWGSTGCAAKGGYWTAKNDGTGQSGCWFNTPELAKTCNQVCEHYNLSCAEGDWDDDSSCSICFHWYAGPACVVEEYGANPRWTSYSGGQCRRRGTNTHKDCSLTGDPSNSWLFCVCEP